MNKQLGFSLIEVLLAIMVSAMIATLLFTAFNGINRIVRFVDNAVDLSTRATIALHQCERDLVGAFEPKQEKLTHIFFGSNNGDNLDTLTFITTDPVPSYWTGALGTPKPRLVRVTYRLVPESAQSQRAGTSYRLMRQESENLTFVGNDATNVRAFELVRGIKQLKVSYTAEIIKNKTVGPTKEGATAQPKGPMERSYAKMSAWNRETKNAQGKEEDAQFADVPSKVPRMVEMELSLWDLQHKRDKKMTMTVLIPANSVSLISEKTQQQIKTDQETAVKAAFGEGVQLITDSQGVIRLASNMELP